MQVCILLDRSGSMEPIWDEALSSINAYVNELNPKTKVHFAVFDSVNYRVVESCRAGEWKPLKRTKEFGPRGTTPLYDSVARIIEFAKLTNNPRTVLVVMTDGFENASKHTSLIDVKRLLTAFKDRGWATVFLGAGFDEINLVAHSLDVSQDKYINFKKDTMVMNMSNLGVRTMAYANTGAEISYSDADKLAAENVEGQTASNNEQLLRAFNQASTGT